MDIRVDKFKPRPYQLPFIKAFEKDKFKRLVICWPRRAGKDLCAFNLLLREALRNVGMYYYIFPTYSQAKKVIWSALTNTGERFLDFIPKELIHSENSQEMKIILINNSLIQLVGSDNVDSLVGTNPRGIIFSEYALQENSQVYQFMSPILVANGGWAIFVSTPRGQNAFYDLFRHAEQHPDWYAQRLTLNDTKHIPMELIEKEKEEGIMSEDLIQQEYFCSWDMGIQGSYYGRYMDNMHNESRIGDVPYEPGFPVSTAWDLGIADPCSIIFYQQVAGSIRIIDYYEASNDGYEYLAKMVKEKPYIYNYHFAPHDIAVREQSTGTTRLSKAQALGIDFITAPKLGIEDGIEAVRTILPRCYIDSTKCKYLIKALEMYRREWNERMNVYKNKPAHDQYSHCADAFRVLATTIHMAGSHSSAEDLNRRYQKAINASGPDPFYGFKRIG